MNMFLILLIYNLINGGFPGAYSEKYTVPIKIKCLMVTSVLHFKHTNIV